MQSWQHIRKQSIKYALMTEYFKNALAFWFLFELDTIVNDHYSKELCFALTVLLTSLSNNLSD